MAFNQQEQDIIKWGLANGKSQQEVSTAITNYRIGITPSKTVNAPQQPGYISDVTNNISNDINSRVNKVGDILNRKDTGVVEKGVQVLGQGAGAAANAMEQTVNNIPGVKEVTGAIGSGINWLATSDWSPIKHLGDIIGNSKTLQEVTSLYNSDPNFKDTVDGVANLARLGLDVKGAVDSAAFAKNVTTKLAPIIKNTASDVASNVSSTIDSVKNTISPPSPIPGSSQAFDNSIAEAKKIVNPTSTYTPSEKETAYLKGNVEIKGKGLLKKEVINPPTTPQTEALAKMVDEGKISSKKLPSENIQAINQEVARTEGGINEIVNKPELNKPFTKATINKALDNIPKTAKDNLTFVSDSVEQKAYQQVIDLAKQEVLKNPLNSSGLRTSIKAFNARMAKILGNDIYGSNAESIGNARLQAVKDTRAGLNDFLGNNLESPTIKKSAFANTKTVNKLPAKSTFEYGKTEGGSIYKAQLQKEAQLLNARDEIAYRNRGTIGKTKIQKIMKANPVATKIIKTGIDATGLGVGVNIIK